MSGVAEPPETEKDRTMHGFSEAVRAYATASSRRSVRQQEAEVFRTLNAALRHGRDSGGAARTRALANVIRLWNSVIDLLGDPENALPPDLRAAIISLGMAVRREAQRDEPEIDFIIAVNENIAAGLAAGT